MEFDNKNKETLLLNFFHGQELHVKKVKYFFFRIKITGRVRVPSRHIIYFLVKVFKGFCSWKYGLATLRFDLK